MHTWIAVASLSLVACVSAPPARPLGQFSVSLAVKDLAASRAFYERLGFVADAHLGGARWVILRCGDAVIGLFQGAFDRNTLTFNPTDVRTLHGELAAKGVAFTVTPTGDSGPAFAMTFDPDGNPILFDQH